MNTNTILLMILFIQCAFNIHAQYQTTVSDGRTDYLKN